MRFSPVYFKSYPRCKGDLAYEKDGYGMYFSCLQCGHHYYPNGNNRPILETLELPSGTKRTKYEEGRRRSRNVQRVSV